MSPKAALLYINACAFCRVNLLLVARPHGPASAPLPLQLDQPQVQCDLLEFDRRFEQARRSVRTISVKRFNQACRSDPSSFAEVSAPEPAACSLGRGRGGV